ncbi:hypothetical protein P280DRAFT_85020 [Massarina eburnea CBS 473.64]|uniref:Sialidase domain-containing protein n=1 Tax=Massarina eburnea CBS 473.64 TaxID=1395130 RepID=A0A6A6RS69_9PLEO|nr:hypothetical protein P280DRAFT_85020 [Massarina eburnea CBS 473.64]
MYTRLPTLLTLLHTLLPLATTTSHPASTSYWQISPPLNTSDALTAGLPSLPLHSQTLVYNGTRHKRTYAHHPSLYTNNHGRLFLQYSTSPIDEDTTGQESWLSTSTDDGTTWSEGVSILPTALLDNQTDTGPANYSYWCEKNVWMRAVHPLAWVPIRVTERERATASSPNNTTTNNNQETLYAVSQTTLRYCWSASTKGTKGGGRIARRIDSKGNAVGAPCWTEKNYWTEVARFNETIYGTRYGMRYCEHAAYIEEYLKEPDTTPAWGSWLYGTKMYAEDGVHDVQEPTHAVWFDGGNSTYEKGARDERGRKREGKGGEAYWQRFWRDISNSNTISNKLWTEHTASLHGSSWYPNTLSQYNNSIYETDIPDVGSKAHYGIVPPNPNHPSSNPLSLPLRFLIHNPLPNPSKYRQPLTIATSRGDSPAFTGIGVLRTNASTIIAPDTRGLKRLMFSYPTAIVVGQGEGGQKLVVSYSENKENIWVSVVRVRDLL